MRLEFMGFPFFTEPFPDYNIRWKGGGTGYSDEKLVEILVILKVLFKYILTSCLFYKFAETTSLVISSNFLIAASLVFDKDSPTLCAKQLLNFDATNFQPSIFCR